MSCKRFDQEWEGWLRGQASREFLAHLGQCRACAGQAVELARTGDWLARLRPEPPLPATAFWARLGGRPGAGAPRALGVLVPLMTLGVLLQPSPAAVTDFDAPQSYLEESNGVAVANGQLNRDQGVLTLVAYQEPQRCRANGARSS